MNTPPLGAFSMPMENQICFAVFRLTGKRENATKVVSNSSEEIEQRHLHIIDHP